MNHSVVGPRLVVTGPQANKTDFHAAGVCRNNPFCLQGLVVEPQNEEQARQAVWELARAKVDAVKIAIDDRFPNMPPLSDSIVAALVHEAHRSESLVHDSERGPLVRHAFEDLATGHYTKQEVIARATDRTTQPEGPAAIATELRTDDAESDLRRTSREPGLRRLDQGRLRAACRGGHVLSRAGRARRSYRGDGSTSAKPSRPSPARFRAL